MPPSPFSYIIFWGSFLAWPFLIFVIWYWQQQKINLIPTILLTILTLVFIWARFIEPQLIRIQTTKIDIGFDSKIVLLSDIHLGVYKDQHFLERIVNRVNKIDPDLVLIAGDFVYQAKIEKLPQLFAPLSQIDSTVYAILGNHDHDHGQQFEWRLQQVLLENQVTLLENKMVEIDDFILLGLKDFWTGQSNISLLQNLIPEDKVVVLTHNPDLTTYFPNKNADITLCGHTHAGQIRLPWLYHKAIPTEGSFNQGLTQEPKTKLFITSGLGEVILPMRLFNPPVIDVLELY